MARIRPKLSSTYKSTDLIPTMLNNVGSFE